MNNGVVNADINVDNFEESNKKLHYNMRIVSINMLLK